MTEEQIHVDKHRQRMTVSSNAWQYAVRILFGKMTGFHHFRSDKIRGAHHVGRILSRDNQAVYVNDAGMSHFWIDKHVFIA